jgi:subtilisin family serine protease
MEIRGLRVAIACVSALAAALFALPAAAAGSAGSDRYIIVLKDSVGQASPVAARHGSRFRANVERVYEHALKGYVATLTQSQAAALASDPQVASIERDQPVHVKAYVIDTGIRFSHSDFGGRAVSGYDAVDGGTADDCNGHGTHVAGTIGGSTYGAAKSVTLVGVRVLNCSGSGTTSGVIAGVDWVTANHGAGQPAVANMSLGGGAWSARDPTVANSIADGVSYAVAAGNGNRGGVAQNACNYSPARVSEAMTIGATDKTDRKASWSNYGSCVDWFAPGVSITSAWYTSNTATNTISGTSMATPHTAGVAALYLQGSPSASPATVRSALYTNTTKSIVTSSSTTNNHLLFTNY